MSEKVHWKFQATYNIQRNNSTASFQQKKASKKKSASKSSEKILQNSFLKNFYKNSTSKKSSGKKTVILPLPLPGFFGPSKTSVLGYPQVVGRPRNWIIEPLQDRFILHRIQPEKSKKHEKTMLGSQRKWAILFVPNISKKKKHHMVYCIY